VVTWCFPRCGHLRKHRFAWGSSRTRGRTTRAGSLRASFHRYTTEADVDLALEALTA